MKKFKKIYLEITNVCNLNCKFCAPTKRASKFIEVDTFNKILTKVARYTDLVFLHIKGEPLLHPELEIILNLCYQHHLQVNLTTNGTLIGQVKDTLKGALALRQINFSLHSLAENDYTIEVKAYLDEIFSFMKDRPDLYYSLRLWNIGQDKNHEANLLVLKQIEKYFKLQNLEETLKMVDSLKLADKVYLNQDMKFNWPQAKEENNKMQGFCYGLRDHIGILVDGTVIPCCLDGDGIINLGNILENELETILSSKLARSIYDGFSNREAVHKLCQACEFKSRF